MNYWIGFGVGFLNFVLFVVAHKLFNFTDLWQFTIVGFCLTIPNVLIKILLDSVSKKRAKI